MELIIDTQAFIWFITGATEISRNAKDAIIHPNNTLYISIASLWEIAIKTKLGKLNINNAPYSSLIDDITENGLQILSINFNHTIQTTLLDLHHRDPFDRIIIAQAISEEMNVVSIDEIFDRYLQNEKVRRIW